MARRSDPLKASPPAVPGGNRHPLRVVAGGARPAGETSHPARWSRPHVPVVVIASGKGGVGKSTLAANLAVALGERGARVLLVDADFAQASLDLLLGLHPRHDLQHVLAGEKTLEEIVVRGPRGVTLVPAASGAPELADLDDVRLEFLLRGLTQLETGADLMLIDTASGISRTVTSLCLAADVNLVVTTPEMPAFSDAYGLMKLLHHQGLSTPPHLLVNMAGSAEEAEETAHRIGLVARRFLRMTLEPWEPVPFDSAIPRAVRLQEPVLTSFPHSPAAAAYRAIADRLWSAVLPPEPSLERDQPQRLEA
jgi:flagellar biosynthesis protein FlhG